MFPGKFNKVSIDRLCHVCHQLAEQIGGGAVLLNSKTLAWSFADGCSWQGINCEDFLLLLSPEFSVVLGWQNNTESGDSNLAIALTVTEIVHFLSLLKQGLPTKHQSQSLLKKWIKGVQPNNIQWQNQFVLKLIESLSVENSPAVTESAETTAEKLLYETQLQGQKYTLEQHVDQRTSELRDALIVAQAASEAKTEFLAMLSHELRTPLTSILGLSYTLLNLLNGNLDNRQKSYLQIIKHSGDHLLELIDDMLEMSKLEAGRAVLKISDFSVVKLLQQVLPILQPRAELRQIDLQIQIMDGEEDISKDASQDILFCGDTKRIKQILINLLTNAIKFTGISGQIVLRTWREFDYLVLQVEDTGIGIAQDQIPLIFQKFHQVDSTLDREYEGMGLGLALTKQLVELHGGWIEVESMEGNGSTFTVWLASQSLRPAKTERPGRLARNSDEKRPAKTIVLVEDNKEDAGGLVADILTAAGYQVVSLSETYLAHKQIELWQPDLVIIDQEIGQEPTDHILRYLHKLTKTQHIRYLLISTADHQNSKEQVVDVDLLFWNHVQPEQLLNKIANII